MLNRQQDLIELARYRVIITISSITIMKLRTTGVVITKPLFTQWSLATASSDLVQCSLTLSEPTISVGVNCRPYRSVSLPKTTSSSYHHITNSNATYLSFLSTTLEHLRISFYHRPIYPLHHVVSSINRCKAWCPLCSV